MVDIQHDFIDGSLAVSRALDIIPVINEVGIDQSGSALNFIAAQLRLHGGFDVVALTLDWHPPNHCSFARNARLHVAPHPHDPMHASTLAEFQTVTLRTGAQQVRPPHVHVMCMTGLCRCCGRCTVWRARPARSSIRS